MESININPSQESIERLKRNWDAYVQQSETKSNGRYQSEDQGSHPKRFRRDDEKPTTPVERAKQLASDRSRKFRLKEKWEQKLREDGQLRWYLDNQEVLTVDEVIPRLWPEWVDETKQSDKQVPFSKAKCREKWGELTGFTSKEDITALQSFFKAEWVRLKTGEAVAEEGDEIIPASLPSTSRSEHELLATPSENTHAFHSPIFGTSVQKPPTRMQQPTLLQRLQDDFSERISDMHNDYVVHERLRHRRRTGLPRVTWDELIQVALRVTDPTCMAWAKIHTFDKSPLGDGGSSLGGADVVYLTTEELQEWSTQMKPFPVPFVVSSPKTKWEPSADKRVIDFLNWRMDILGSDTELDIQSFGDDYQSGAKIDPTSESESEADLEFAFGVIDLDPQTDKLSCGEIVRRIKKEWLNSSETKLQDDQQPLNLLNLNGETAHAFHRKFSQNGGSFGEIDRFTIAERITQSLNNKHQGTSGKKNRATVHRGRDIDFQSCMNFLIASGYYSISGCHLDSFVGTTVTGLCGIKLWFYTDGLKLSNKDRKTFQVKGPFWVPPKGVMKLILLRPGEELIMPPNLRCIHCPISLVPTVMSGGLIWDQAHLPEMLKNLRYIIDHAAVTNEGVSKQLPVFLTELTKQVKDKSDVFQDKDKGIEAAVISLNKDHATIMKKQEYVEAKAKTKQARTRRAEGTKVGTKGKRKAGVSIGQAKEQSQDTREGPENDSA